MTHTSKTVTFRLSGSQHDRLAREAELRGVSTGELARRLVLETLESGRDDGVARRLIEVQQQLRRLHLAVGRTCMVLLVDAGHCEEADAKQWVQDELLKDVDCRDNRTG